MGKLYSWLFKHVLRIDMDVDGPPWPVAIFNVDTGVYEQLGIPGAVGPTGPSGPTGGTGPQGPAGSGALSGLLSLPPQRSATLDGDYLATMDGLAVLTSAGSPIATQPLRIVALEEHIMTSMGETIAV